MVAQIDYMRDAVRHIEHTPTVEVLRDGRCVDMFLATDSRKMKDRLWLWCSTD